MTTSQQTPDLEKITALRLKQWREVPGLLERDLPVGVAVFQLIAEGRPLTTKEAAAVLGWPVEEVTPLLEKILGYVGVEHDSEGHVRAAETTMDGVQLPVFKVRWLDTGKTAEIPGCNGDALLPVLAAGRRAQIELPCAATGTQITVTVGSNGKFEGVEPAGAIAITDNPKSSLNHPRDWARRDCANGQFFVSAEAASSWLAEHPGYVAVPMEFFIRSEAEFYARAIAEIARPTKLHKPGAEA